VDRYDRRKVIVLSTLGRSAAMGALTIALVELGFHLSFVLLAVLVFTVLSTFFGPASQALLPQIVPASWLADANGLFQSSEEVVGIVASALGGIFIVTIGAVPSLGVDAISYLVAAVFIVLIVTATSRAALPKQDSSLFGQVREGFAYLRRNTALFELTLAALVLNFLFAFVLTYIVVFSTGPLHGNAVVFAALEAILSAGVATGALLVGRLRLTRYAGAMWGYAGLAQGTAVLALVLLPTLPVALAAAFAWGAMNGILNVAWLSTVQVLVPERMQGRYYSIDNMFSFAAIPAAQILGGILIISRGVSFTFLLVGVGSVVAGIVYFFLTDLRKLGYDPAAAPG